MKGLVVKSTGIICTVFFEGKNYNCRIKGKSRLDKIEFTNPVSVGDYVDFTYDYVNSIGFIEKVHDRKNYIIRKSVNLSHRGQVIASNIDQAMLMITIENPSTSLNFIDGFLVQSAAYDIETILVINKIDLMNDKTETVKKEITKIYQEIGYEVLSISVKDDVNIQTIKKNLKNKVTLISGHSGVGKSSLINSIQPDLSIETREISNYHKQGVHTTTFSNMYTLKLGGYLIDTPGIKGLGLMDVNMDNLSKYFPEMLSASEYCKFNNCMHINEPGCGVKKALEEERIATSRYQSYLSMLDKNSTYRKNNYEL